jgi:hypothetical protein
MWYQALDMLAAQAATASDDSDRMRKVFESKAQGVRGTGILKAGLHWTQYRTRRGW